MFKGFLVVLVLAFIGCTSGSDDESSPAVTIDGDHIAESTAELMCAKLVECRPVLSEFFVGDDCVEGWRQRMLTGMDAFVAAVEAGRIGYDESQFDACIARGSAAPCGDASFAEVLALADCSEALTGLVPDGDSCTLNPECGPDSYCAKGADGESCGGTCEPRLAVNEVCSEDDDCASERCLNRCAVVVELGETCDPEDSELGSDAPRVCAVGANCTTDDMGENPTCVDDMTTFDLEEGESCGANSALCQGDLFCAASPDFRSFTCAPRIALGETCTFGFLNPCESGSVCVGIDFEAGIVEGTCVAVPGVDEMCRPEEELSRCQTGLRCNTDGVCKAFKVLGDACESDEECYSERCEASEMGTSVCAGEPICELE